MTKYGIRYGIAAMTAVCILAAPLFGCASSEEADGDPNYFSTVCGYSFWDNDGARSIAQYKLYDVMDGFLSGGEIQNGSCVKDGIVRKVLFVGWDGVRADALPNVVFDANSGGLNYPAPDYSGLNRLKQSGGIYLAYAGGEKGKASEQETSTCAGFTSELTGGWHTEHGVNRNYDVKNSEHDTIMLKYAKLGLNTGLAFEWGQYFDTSLRGEVEYLLDNPETPLRLCDINRKAASSEAEVDDKAASLAHYNAVAMPAGEWLENSEYDIAMRDYILRRINAGDDFVGGIFHGADKNGHSGGFGNGNIGYVNAVHDCDTYLYSVLDAVAEREASFDEDWLVIVAADHGGSKKTHGKQIYEHRTIWVASNKKIDEKYFGKNYNGYNE